jgi:hypothetical protein
MQGGGRRKKMRGPGTSSRPANGDPWHKKPTNVENDGWTHDIRKDNKVQTILSKLKDIMSYHIDD